MFRIIYVGLAESCDMSWDDLDSPMVPICQNKFQGSFQFVLIAELSLQLFSPNQPSIKTLILSLLFPGARGNETITICSWKVIKCRALASYFLRIHIYV